MEYPGIIECAIMRAQDVLIIPFQLSWQELGSWLQQSRHGYLSFYYHCPCDRQVYYCTVLPDFLNGEANYSATFICPAGRNFCKITVVKETFSINFYLSFFFQPPFNLVNQKVENSSKGCLLEKLRLT